MTTAPFHASAVNGSFCIYAGADIVERIETKEHAEIAAMAMLCAAVEMRDGDIDAARFPSDCGGLEAETRDPDRLTRAAADLLAHFAWGRMN